MASEYGRTLAQTQTAAQIDEGLRAFMLRVYNYMGSGLALTGIVALITASTPAIYEPIFTTPLRWVVILAPLAFVLALSFGIQRMKFATAQALFWLFSVAMGLSLSSILLVYTGESVARVFFISAGVFGAMSLYGYTTKRSLAAWGSFLIMGLIGVIIASVVNLFIGWTPLQFAISVIGVLVFTGLTAYDTQRIKQIYLAGDAEVTMGRKALMGALTLYLDFINLFIMLMHLLGNRR